MVEALREKKAPDLELLPPGGGQVLVEFGSNDPAESRARAEQLVAFLKRQPAPPPSRIYNDKEAKAVWRIRESGPRAAAFAPERRSNGKVGTMPPSRPKSSADICATSASSWTSITTKADSMDILARLHSHARHLRFDVGAGRQEIRRVCRTSRRSGGQLRRVAFGEHGDGQSRGALLPKMFGPN